MDARLRFVILKLKLKLEWRVKLSSAALKRVLTFPPDTFRAINPFANRPARESNISRSILKTENTSALTRRLQPA